MLGLVDDRRDAFVADLAGVVVGYADGIEGSRSDGAGGTYEVARVYVVPQAWGRGVGRGLVDSLLAAARARGIERVDVEVDAENPEGLRFWERMGFARSGAGTYELPPWSRATIRLARAVPPRHPPM